MFRTLTLLSLLSCASVFAIDFTQYHTLDQINQYMQGLAQSNPAMVKYYVLGNSDQGKPITYITMTKGDAKTLPGILFNGTHHGNEWSATEGIVGLIDYLMTNQNDPKVAKLLNQYVFYLEPAINPDGHDLQTREDVNGQDPNRDYMWPGAAAGSKFKSVIISLEKTLIDSHKFRAAAAYHSGIEEVLWSWCYTNSPTKDNDLLYTFAKTAATAMNMDRYLQSYDDYETEGEFIDYAYMTQGTYALTYEVSDDYTPPESDLAFYVTRSITGAMAFIQAVADHDNGTLKIEPQPQFTHVATRNPFWDLIGQKLE